MSAYLGWIVLFAMCPALAPLGAVEPAKLQRLKAGGDRRAEKLPRRSR